MDEEHPGDPLAPPIAPRRSRNLDDAAEQGTEDRGLDRAEHGWRVEEERDRERTHRGGDCTRTESSRSVTHRRGQEPCREIDRRARTVGGQDPQSDIHIGIIAGNECTVTKQAVISWADPAELGGK
ncbi:MAG TPA: hypothetical protein VII08_04580 [Myxococcales bacterium]